MGGGISLAPSTDPNDTKSIQYKLKALLANKKNMDKLFKKIATLNKKTKKDIDIGQVELLEYFVMRVDSKKDVALRSFATTPDVVNAAFKHVVGKGKATSSGVSKKQFRVLLPTLFLYSELWKIFEVVDNCIDDKKIFKGEFLRAYPSFQLHTITHKPPGCEDISDERIAGVQMKAVTEEMWENEFNKLDKDKNGYITFEEFCSYAVKNIITPMDYMDKEISDETTEMSNVEVENENENENENVELSEDGNIVTASIQQPLVSGVIPDPGDKSVTINDSPAVEGIVTVEAASNAVPVPIAETGDEPVAVPIAVAVSVADTPVVKQDEPTPTTIEMSPQANNNQA